MSTSDLDWLTQVVVERAAGLRLFAQQWVDAATAEDVVQEALVALLAERPAPQNPIAWMYRVVRNAAFNHHRSSTRRWRRERVVAEARGDWFESRPDVAIDARAAEQALASLTAAQDLTFDTSSPRQRRYGGDNFVGIDWFCNMHLKASE